MATTTGAKLTGQVALITGASSGIGRAIARTFLNEGADLVVVARRSERLQELADEAQKSGRRCAVVVGDVREEETATNMRSTFLFTRHVVPVLLQRGTGTIITIASMAGVMGFAGESVYCATKFAQVGFTQALDRELRPHGLKVGVICPGGVKTEFAIGTGRTEEGVAASDMLEADDVAAAALLMASQPKHSRITEIRMRPMVEPLFGRDPK